MGGEIAGFAAVVAAGSAPLIPESQMADLIAKLLGSFFGAALALVFVPPRTKSGFVRRATASLIVGIVFASYVREWAGFAQDWEGLVSASCLAAFVAWWAMGSAIRIVRLFKSQT
jgi:hypothetical protein